MKKCETKDCSAEAVKGRRFCKACGKAMKEQMKSEGYLAPRLRHSGGNRSQEMKEDVRATKFGRGT